jgi:RecA-family ATPase
MARPEVAGQPDEEISEIAAPLAVEPVSLLADRDPPPPRDSVCKELSLHAARVATLIGNGGFGKTTIGQQLAIAVATSRPFCGMAISGGPVLGVWCEDEQAEIDRKTRAIAAAEQVSLESLDNLFMLSRDGQDNLLAIFERDQILLTSFYERLDATIASIKPRLTILDTAADMFAGDFMSTTHVRQFIKVALGGLCARHGTSILLLAHPSASGMASGDGGGFSTAWNNSVRSRLYLRRPKSDDQEAIADRRILQVMKANYGPTGGLVPLIYSEGRFILDPEPIEEGAKSVRAARSDTRLTLAIMGYFRAFAASGQVVAFRAVFESLQSAGDIPRGNYETVRKPLQRALKDLVSEGLLRLCSVPRGYRIAVEITP